VLGFCRQRLQPSLPARRIERQSFVQQRTYADHVGGGKGHDEVRARMRVGELLHMSMKLSLRHHDPASNGVLGRVLPQTRP
jgi:hypothetical protein